MHGKIKSLEEIQAILEKDRQLGLRIVQCHGVFDLLHPGHIRHFKSAKSKGDKLVVTITPDRFVNKGPGRPSFTEALRLESLAALEDIDYVVLNDSPDAISAIQKVRPSLYVKGNEYANHASDVTGKITEEAKAVEQTGGAIFYTDDIVFSSSSLLNQFLDATSPEVHQFLVHLKTQFSVDDLIEQIHSLQHLKVLVVGDAIIDEYQYVDPMGVSGKGHHIVAKCLEKEIFLGGSLVVANHVAQFAKQVTLLTAIGQDCPHGSLIQKGLDPAISREFVYQEETTTLLKKRYVLKDGKHLSKLFETYSGHEHGLTPTQTAQIIQYIQNQGDRFDLILAADFGNGFTNPQIIHSLSDTAAFLAVNTQTNGGNRGYNTITNYQRADYISLNEPEIRLSLHNKNSPLEGLAIDLMEIMQSKFLSVTRGVKGVHCFSRQDEPLEIPAFASYSVDRIGAGDAYLSLSSLCLAKKMPFKLAAMIGSLAAALSVQMIGNQDAIRKASLIKYLIRLMK